MLDLSNPPKYCPDCKAKGESKKVKEIDGKGTDFFEFWNLRYRKNHEMKNIRKH